jgi:N-acetylglucosaminyldiphosphoundecaprenol N-acetyl-beta-D-mannosaminyltransferase
MENRDVLACGAALGLGGSLDVFAGTGRLAPEWMRRAGLEWLFRLVREPRRWRRMLDLPRFVLLTFKVKWAGRQKKTPAA